MEWRKGSYVLTDDASRVDVSSVHAWLQSTYWAKGRSREVVEETVRNSLCLSLFAGERQVGFARVVTDRATFAWICDVFILSEMRGEGLGKWMMECVVDHPAIQHAKQILMTRDAHGLYARYGFEPAEVMLRPKRRG